MGRKKKHLKEDKYYFEVGNITIHRDSKKMAKKAYDRYDKVGKEASWLGKWDGKDFITEES